jgi:plastocyanin
MSRLALALLACTLSLSASLHTIAAGEPEFSLVIEKNKFTPDRLEVPAGKKVKINIDNKDATAEEFESHDLKIEKVIAAKSKASVFVGPLKAGEYKFVGEFHEKTAKGVIVAK